MNDIRQIRKYFEKALNQQLIANQTDLDLLKPMTYSLQNGGKRLRPMLLLSILSIYGDRWLDVGMKTAIALEYIHTYSLIHDDLPAMDNDDMRRGQPSNHKQFDEATAILAGDALLTDAFALIGQDELLNDTQKVKLMTALSLASGSLGMVAGQLQDLYAEEQVIPVDTLKAIHAKKTGALFSFAVQAAADILALEQMVRHQLDQFITHFGLAYQIHNDLKDLSHDTLVTGKQGSSDLTLDKATYPALLGVQGALDALKSECDACHQAITALETEADPSYNRLRYFVEKINPESLTEVAHG